jgi:hypothetical protein
MRSMRQVIGWELRYGDGSRILLELPMDGAPPAGAWRRAGEPSANAVARAWREHRRDRLSVVNGGAGR